MTLSSASPRVRALSMLLVLDAAVLFLVGGAMLVAPKQIEFVFHFRDLPAGVSYLIGLWGCALLTMAIGYAVAATDPRRHVAWVQVGIARGALECMFGIVAVVRGVVTWPQAGLGIILCGLIAAAYLALYPQSRKVES
jgi:hypothetical protein